MSYSDDGFTIVRNVINARLMDNVREMIEDQVGDIDDGYQSVDKDDHSIIAQMYETLRHSTQLNSIIYSPAVLSEIEKINRKCNYLLYHVCRMDPPTDERFTYGWHQQSYYSVYEADEIQLWAPLFRRNTKDMGTISVLRGSHEVEIPHTIEATEGGHTQMHVPPDRIDGDFKEIHIEIDAGDILLFHPVLLHRSNVNISQMVRYSLVASYVDWTDSRFRITTPEDRLQYHRDRCRPSRALTC